MKGIIYIALMGICFALFACQSDEPLVADGADSRIYLTAEVEHALVQSRTPYWLSEPTADNPLLVDVWAATTTPPDYIFVPANQVLPSNCTHTFWSLLFHSLMCNG